MMMPNEIGNVQISILTRTCVEVARVTLSERRDGRGGGGVAVANLTPFPGRHSSQAVDDDDGVYKQMRNHTPEAIHSSIGSVSETV